MIEHASSRPSPRVTTPPEPSLGTDRAHGSLRPESEALGRKRHCAACQGVIPASGHFCPRCGAAAPAAHYAPEVQPLPAVNGRSRVWAIAVPALVLVPLAAIAFLAPFVTLWGDVTPLVHATRGWPLLVPGMVASAASVAALRGNREGVAAAAGVGLVFVGLGAIALSQAWALDALDPTSDGSPRPGIGAISWVAASVVTIVLCIQTALVHRRRRPESSTLPAGAIGLVMAGTGFLIVGTIVPTATAPSISGHLFDGNEWADALRLYLIASPVVGTVLLVVRPTRFVAHLMVGIGSWYAALLWFETDSHRHDYPLLHPVLSGDPAWMTAGVALLTIGLLLGIPLADYPRDKPRSGAATREKD